MFLTSLLTVGAASLFRGLALKKRGFKRGFIWQNFCVFFISLVLLFFPSLLMAHGDVMPHNHADTTFSKNLSLFFFLLLPISVFFAYFLKKSLFSKEVGPSSK